MFVMNFHLYIVEKCLFLSSHKCCFLFPHPLTQKQTLQFPSLEENDVFEGCVLCRIIQSTSRFFHCQSLDHWFLLSANQLLPVTLKCRFLGEHYSPKEKLWPAFPWSSLLPAIPGGGGRHRVLEKHDGCRRGWCSTSWCNVCVGNAAAGQSWPSVSSSGSSCAVNWDCSLIHS